jgi:hypothetical protein
MLHASVAFRLTGNCVGILPEKAQKTQAIYTRKREVMQKAV